MGFEFSGPLELGALVESTQARTVNWEDDLEMDELTGRLERLTEVEAWVLTVRANATQDPPHN